MEALGVPSDSEVQLPGSPKVSGSKTFSYSCCFPLCLPSLPLGPLNRIFALT